MRIFGVDPGTATTGYAVVEKDPLSSVAYGVIKTTPVMETAQRLSVIFDELSALLAEHSPDVLVIEKIFFSRNVKTAMAVGHARGVIMLAGHKFNLPIFEYTPNEVKQAISGYGSADKKQVQEMMKMFLNLDEIPKPDDAADALAIAVTHANTNQRLKN